MLHTLKQKKRKSLKCAAFIFYLCWHLDNFAYFFQIFSAHFECFAWYVYAAAPCLADVVKIRGILDGLSERKNFILVNWHSNLLLTSKRIRFSLLKGLVPIWLPIWPPKRIKVVSSLKRGLNIFCKLLPNLNLLALIFNWQI